MILYLHKKFPVIKYTPNTFVDRLSSSALDIESEQRIIQAETSSEVR